MWRFVSVLYSKKIIMANDTRADALDLGVIELEPTVTNDQIGFRVDGKRERNDYYKFKLDEESDFSLTLDKLDKNANVQILDSDGSVLFKSIKTGKKPEIINEQLDAGEYFVRVLPKDRAQTDYRLSLNADPITAGSDDELPGVSLGVLDSEEEVKFTDEIGFTRGGQRDKNDYFNFTLDQDSDVSLTLDQLKGNANVQIWDDKGKTLLLQSRNKGRQEETINTILEKGDYLVRVFPQGRARTSYRLGLSADEMLPPEKLPGTDVGDLLDSEEPHFAIEDIGFGRGRQRNTRDYYTFELSQEASFYAELDQLKRNADIYLYEYDPDEPEELGSRLNKSTRKGRRPDTISEFLPEGHYALEVRPRGAAKTDYRLELDARINVDDFPAPEMAKDLGELVPTPTNETGNNVGLLTDDRFRDQADWFKFTLSAEKNVDLTLDELRVNAADAEIYDADGTTRLYKSKNKGKQRETINENLDAGTYYVKVVARGSGNTNYRLSLSADEPISPTDTFPLGTLESPTEYSNNDKIGGEGGGVRNSQDEYTFTINELTEFNATLDQIKRNVDLELYKGSRLVDSSKEKRNNPEIIDQVLEPGDYTLRVMPMGNAETTYRLGIDTEVVAEGDETFEVGSLLDLNNNEYKERGRIGYSQNGSRNLNDFYNLTLDNNSNFRLTLDEMTRDANVMVLDSEGDMVLSGFNPDSAPEILSDTLDAGDYTVQVFPVGNAKTNYFLKMNADPLPDPPDDIDDGDDDDMGDDGDETEVDPITGDPDGTPEDAIDLGSDLLTQSGKIGFTENGVDDVNDYYKFTLDANDDIRIILSGLNQNADLTLLDSDGETVISDSSNSGTNTERIKATLDAGDYYLQVEAVDDYQSKYTIDFF